MGEKWAAAHGEGNAGGEPLQLGAGARALGSGWDRGPGLGDGAGIREELRGPGWAGISNWNAEEGCAQELVAMIEARHAGGAQQEMRFLKI